jgi:hypothetical protein
VGWRNVVLDYNDNVIGEADPGFKPLPEDLAWADRVEYAMHYGLPHPREWTKKLRDEYEQLYPEV